jgi:hypothetical protein
MGQRGYAAHSILNALVFSRRSDTFPRESEADEQLKAAPPSCWKLVRHSKLSAGLRGGPPEFPQTDGRPCAQSSRAALSLSDGALREVRGVRREKSGT